MIERLEEGLLAEVLRRVPGTQRQARLSARAFDDAWRAHHATDLTLRTHTVGGASGYPNWARFPGLRRVVLSGGHPHLSGDVERLLPNLKSLTARRGHECSTSYESCIDPDMAGAVVNHCPRLESLDAGTFKLDWGSAALLAQLPRLRELRCGWPCYGETDDASLLTALQPGHLEALSLPGLARLGPLSLSRLHELRGIECLRPEGAAALARGAPLLRLLVAGIGGPWGAWGPAHVLPRVTRAHLDYDRSFRDAEISLILPAVQALSLQPCRYGEPPPGVAGLTALETLVFDRGNCFQERVPVTWWLGASSLPRLRRLLFGVSEGNEVWWVLGLPALEVLHVNSDKELDVAHILAAAACCLRVHTVCSQGPGMDAPPLGSLAAFAAAPGRVSRAEVWGGHKHGLPLADARRLAALPFMRRLGAGAWDDFDLDAASRDHEAGAGAACICALDEHVIDLRWID
ncbi:MAG: hypothetical protein J3K34DRAFT_517328 [Monoraphidium minutum]|nr:MAG: hypothetical protein J3K34DRAFT_517328 [Monoraphidium minutum]